ncbi:MAG: hypothetical protein J5I92_11935, partial [Thiogranum sp.]|nr:hypothetical protein [Thiogranum sp.]
AERDAAQAIADCEAQARDLVQAARQQASRIEARADERITLMQMRCAKRLAQALQQLAQTQQAGSAQDPGHLDDASLNACMESVAAALTAAADSAGDGDR